jgi:hypothetical protein
VFFKLRRCDWKLRGGGPILDVFVELVLDRDWHHAVVDHYVSILAHSFDVRTWTTRRSDIVA